MSERVLAGLAAYLDRLVPLDYDYTTASKAPARWPPAPTCASGPTYGGAGIKGAVYAFTGAPGSVVLGAENYLDTVALDARGHVGQPVGVLPANLGNLTQFSANAIGILIVLNDVRATATATVTKVNARPARRCWSAQPRARRSWPRDERVSASGGSFYGAGTVLAVSGQMVTNRVVTHTDGDADRQHGDGDRRRRRRHRRQRRRHRRDAAHPLDSGDEGAVGLAGVQHARLQAVQRALQPDRRAARRPADLDRVQGRGPGARAATVADTTSTRPAP